jgi:hypothetical protein
LLCRMRHRFVARKLQIVLGKWCAIISAFVFAEQGAVYTFQRTTMSVRPVHQEHFFFLELQGKQLDVPRYSPDFGQLLYRLMNAFKPRLVEAETTGNTERGIIKIIKCRPAFDAVALPAAVTLTVEDALRRLDGVSPMAEKRLFSLVDTVMAGTSLVSPFSVFTSVLTILS